MDYINQKLLYCYDTVLSPQMDKYFDYLIEKIRGVQIKKIIDTAGYGPYNGLKNWVFKNEKLILNKISEVVINKLKVPEIVETKINEMEVREMENLVLNVAKKELQYITYMGGVLGFIIGFLPQIINYFI